MEFGRVETSEINKIDFTLPADGEQTKLTLKGKAINDPKFFVGCAKWGRKEWVNLIYPPKTKEKDFLGEYVKHFNSIELNAVFYGIPKEDQILKWKEMADQRDDFLFCPKFSRAITHIKRLNNAQGETDLYLKAISQFGDKLGPCFLQLGDNFGPKNFEVLKQYLEALPRDLNLFLEVRHPDWFSVAADRKALFSLLADLNIGAAITDASGRRDCVHMELPTPKAFIRFVGNGGKFLESSDKKRVDDWVERLQEWLSKGLEEVYFFLHQHDESDTPIIADYTIEKFNKYLKADLPRIKFLPNQGGLF
ncbi:DUF72 domain-containing protein [Nubsella zeaxanthinifaciens]|uniref:DUF72 domain-containing protein n=1 Tax=Nubsella zeaxanthinifaciens TaxID=392412 RepID=UPI000DE5594D|nr:DUF72 domain-containing protein [Nubsella zeaxanthinifaciens]